MFSQVTKKEFALHHQNEVILFQFILHESIQIHKVIHQQSDWKNIKKQLVNMDIGNSFWQNETARLQNLQRYYVLFMNHFAESNPFFLRPLTNFGKTLDSFQKVLNEMKSNLTEELSIQHLKKKCHQIAKSLTEMLIHFKSSENILFFLLTHREDSDRFFGKNFVRNILSDLFSGRIESAKQFITDNYARRGFQYLLPVIQKKFETLKA